MIGSKARTAVLAVVTAVWVLNFAAGFVVDGYEPSESVNAAFMLAVGAVFALGAKKKDGGEGDGP